MSLTYIKSMISFSPYSLMVLPFFYTDYLIAKKEYRIVIDSIGSMQNAGREIHDFFEKGISLQCNQALQAALQKNKNIEIFVAKEPGQVYESTHSLIFTNRKQPDLYLKIGFYEQQQSPNQCALFYYMENSFDLQHIEKPFTFYSIDQIYLKHIFLTKKIAEQFDIILRDKKITCGFDYQGIFAIPCKPLIGFDCPALYLECGLKKSSDWKYIIEPIAIAIESLLS